MVRPDTCTHTWRRKPELRAHECTTCRVEITDSVFDETALPVRGLGLPDAPPRECPSCGHMGCSIRREDVVCRAGDTEWVQRGPVLSTRLQMDDHGRRRTFERTDERDPHGCRVFVECPAPSYQVTHGKAPGYDPIVHGWGEREVGYTPDGVVVYDSFRAAMQGMANVAIGLQGALNLKRVHAREYQEQMSAGDYGACMLNGKRQWYFTTAERSRNGGPLPCFVERGSPLFLLAQEAYSEQVRAKVAALPKPGPRVCVQGEED